MTARLITISILGSLISMGCTHTTLVDVQLDDRIDAGSSVDTDPIDPPPPDTATDTDTIPQITTIKLNGIIVRSTGLSFTGDGIGFFCIGIVHACPSITNIEYKQFGLASAGIVDVSDSESQLPFAVEIAFTSEPTVGDTYAVFGFLAEARESCPEGPLAGDLVVAGDDHCPTFDYRHDLELDGIELDLNIIMPI